MPITGNYEGLSDAEVMAIKSFEAPISGIVDQLVAMQERLEAGTPSASRRTITAQATNAVGDEFAKHVVSLIQKNGGEDPLKILGFVKTMQKAVDDAFGKTLKQYVDARIEELEKESETSDVPKLSDDERNALVEAYATQKNSLDLMIKVLAMMPNGDRIVTQLPTFKGYRVSSGPRKPGGPRIGGFEFIVNGTVVGKSFPQVAAWLKKSGADEVSTLALKEAVARQHNVDPADEEKFKALFKELSGKDSFSFRLEDSTGGAILVIAKATSDTSDAEDASDEDEDEDENETSE